MGRSLHIENARIWTADARKPCAGQVTIRDGLVAALDEPATGEASIDAGGRVVIPGMFDAHTHLLMGGLSLGELDLAGVATREAFEAAIARGHEALEPGEWLIASGWSNERWPGKAPPDKSWLAAAGRRPVVCRRMDIHAALVNDAVLDMIDTSADPEGGRIVRDRAGEPTGLMVEAAFWEMVNPQIPKVTPERKRAALREAMAHCNRFGVTTVMSMEDAKDVEQVIAPMRDELTLRVCVTLLDRGWPMEFSFGHRFRSDESLSVIGCKAFVDGTLGSRTARMLEEYADDPGNRGLFVELAKDGHLRDWARAVVDAGFSPSVHAIGDEAVRLVLDAYEGLDRSRPLRIEHAQHVSPDDIDRFRGLVASMQPMHKADDARYVTDRIGDARLEGFFPFRGLLDAGAILVFGSDWPVAPVDPMLGIRAAASGLTLDGEVFAPQHNITVVEALRAYTVDAARGLGLRDRGQLRPGACGDLVMLDTDLPPEEWNPREPGGAVLLTVVDGEIRYDGRSS